MSTFDQVSGQYERTALVQQAAAEKLLALLEIGEKDDLLDVACGPGHITQRITRLTQGRVLGVDISDGMIDQARAKYPAIEFRQAVAERLDFRDEFDVVFCNSSFQWFTQPAQAVAAMGAALRRGGKLGVSCPATENWSRCFKSVGLEAGAHPELTATFARWKSPWFYLPDRPAYQRLFEGQGFQTIHCSIDAEVSLYDLEQAVAIFLSGAAQGYTGKAFYEVPIDEEYVRRFNAQARQAMEHRARGGKVNVDFQRLYYVGIKP